MKRFELPKAPQKQSGPVKVWSQSVTIPTYRPMPADKNPMFLEKRVYQGSSGKVYPLPFIDRIDDQKIEQAWDAVHLENEHLRVMVLPQIGGRIHVAMDKSNGYDFIYRQDVIKPALVGLAGPWISGGIEFNWPQHHRPSTFMPTEVFIEEHPDGSKTAWFSEHEPMNRMKGMHGVCLHPGKAIIELKARIYNRTALRQTFLWWANVATRVHERYQSFFPPDVHYVADHAKRAMSTFPRCSDRYYGVDYAARGKRGNAAHDPNLKFVPPNGLYSADDLSWYANIPVPTSYMCMGTTDDFMGGYDHALDAGIIHVCSHHISPGKKQWTWGNHEFGYAWDRNLTDADEQGTFAPYIELMAGVYTDNQPDFSFLAPGETRTFSQFWYPIRKIGPARQANVNAAVSLNVAKKSVRVGVAVSSAFRKARITLSAGEKELARFSRDLRPGNPVVEEVKLTKKFTDSDLTLTVTDADGREIIAYRPAKQAKGDVPPPAAEPPPPVDIRSADELYITGLHLEQYRHATRAPEPYWLEALARDPLDARCNNAMGLSHLRVGRFEQAEQHFRRAIDRLTSRNPNPIDGEPHYNRGIALRHLGRDGDAYAALYKSTWDYAWQSAAFLALAEIDCSRGDWLAALDHLDRALRVNTDDLKSRNLRVIVLRKLLRIAEAGAFLRQNLSLDPLDVWSRHLDGQTLTCDTQILLDLALDYARAGLYVDAIALFANVTPDHGTAPLVHYYLGHFHSRAGNTAAAKKSCAAAAKASTDHCFPARLEEIEIFTSAIRNNPKDAKAHYYLGNLLYDRRRHVDAIRHWEQSSRLDKSFSIVWRNLGIGYFNILKKPAQAKSAYEKAFAADPTDARVLYERDQLWKRIGVSPAKRLAELERHPKLVRQRDDLSVELSALLNQCGRHDAALELIQSRNFQPWEGGEGLALGQHVRTHLALGRRALSRGDAIEARQLFELALTSPENLGEAKHLLANQSDVHYWLGLACDAAGDKAHARRHWTAAASYTEDFLGMSVRTFSAMTYFSAMSLQRLGQKSAARKLLCQLLAYAEQLRNTPPTIDYFATSLPTMLLFDDDLLQRQLTAADLLAGLANLGLGNRSKANRLLHRVLEQDPNHALAGDLLSD